MNIAVCDDEENIRYLIKRLIEKLIEKQDVPCQYVFRGGKLFFSVNEQYLFLKYVLSSVKFESEEHEKAWFIRVTINACRDFFRDFFRSHMVPLEELIHQQEELTPDNSEVLEAVLSLPEKYREAVYLYYYEGYTAVEIAHILKKNKNTVYTLLTRSKQLLRERLGGDDCET